MTSLCHCLTEWGPAAPASPVGDILHSQKLSATFSISAALISSPTVTQHWILTGLHSQPPAVCPAHIWLYTNPTNQHHLQVCRWHHRSWAHLWWRWDSIQGGGREFVLLVLKKWPEAKCPQNERTPHGNTVALVKKAQQHLHHLHVSIQIKSFLRTNSKHFATLSF